MVAWYYHPEWLPERNGKWRPMGATLLQTPRWTLTSGKKKKVSSWASTCLLWHQVASLASMCLLYVYRYLSRPPRLAENPQETLFQNVWMTRDDHHDLPGCTWFTKIPIDVFLRFFRDAVHDAKLIHGFLYIYKGSTWQLMLHRGLQIKGMSAQNFFIQQAHDNTGHGGLDKTYQNLTEKYDWKDSFSDVNKFVESCELCQATKSSTQKPVVLLTPLTVPQRPWIKIAMDFFFLT